MPKATVFKQTLVSNFVPLSYLSVDALNCSKPAFLNLVDGVNISLLLIALQHQASSEHVLLQPVSARTSSSNHLHLEMMGTEKHTSAIRVQLYQSAPMAFFREGPFQWSFVLNPYWNNSWGPSARTELYSVLKSSNYGLHNSTLSMAVSPNFDATAIPFFMIAKLTIIVSWDASVSLLWHVFQKTIGIKTPYLLLLTPPPMTRNFHFLFCKREPMLWLLYAFFSFNYYYWFSISQDHL